MKNNNDDRDVWEDFDEITGIELIRLIVGGVLIVALMYLAFLLAWAI